MDIGSCLRQIMLHGTIANSAPQMGSQGSLLLDVFFIIVLVLINGFFSASEMAIVTLNDNKVRKEAEEGNATARKLLRFVNDQGSFLATIQVGVTLAGFLSSAFAADKIAPILYHLIDPAGIRPYLQSVSTVVITIVIAFFSLVLGELVPKRIGMNNPEGFSRTFVGILRAFDWLMRPFTKLLNASAVLVSKMIGLDPNQTEKRITEEEIRLMTEVSRERGGIHSEEALMINNIFELDDKEVSEIMTPRTAMVSLQVNADYHEVVAVAAHERYSRIPIYDENIDDIIGILHIKDLLRVSDEERQSFNLRNYVRDAYFVPETKSINVLFREMQQKKTSLAIVIDEYGGTDGLITIEDVLEEIVGNIEDEYDEQNEDVIINEDGSYVLNGLLTPEEAGRYVKELNELEEDDDYDTIAGFVLSLLERIPDPDENPSVRFNHLKFTVLEMDDRRIAKIRLDILPETTDSDQDADGNAQSQEDNSAAES